MRWVWIAWALFFVVTFAIFEGYALSRPDGLSLSQAVADMSYAWPPIVFLLGLAVGILVTHFWWPWVPKQKRETCQACGKTTLLLVLVLVWPADARADGRYLILPDPDLTPGVARTDLSQNTICKTKWGTDARHVTAAMKREVFASYGLTGNDDPACTRDAHGRACEIDHLISRELGGADHILNLWPQPMGTQPWNAVRKDRVENRLHKEVCAGNISLEQAQRELVTDYRIPYRRYFGEPK